MRFVVFLYVTKGVLGIGHLGVSVKRRAGTGGRSRGWVGVAFLYVFRFFSFAL